MTLPSQGAALLRPVASQFRLVGGIRRRSVRLDSSSTPNAAVRPFPRINTRKRKLVDRQRSENEADEQTVNTRKVCTSSSSLRDNAEWLTVDTPQCGDPYCRAVRARRLGAGALLCVDGLRPAVHGA